MEEERARQEAAAKRAAEESTRSEKVEGASSNSQDVAMVNSDGDKPTEGTENIAAPMVGTVYLYACNCI